MVQLQSQCLVVLELLIFSAQLIVLVLILFQLLQVIRPNAFYLCSHRYVLQITESALSASGSVSDIIYCVCKIDRLRAFHMILLSVEICTLT